ncbi:hypothetical protein Bhyg_03265 [Pseudolycoriella hygida]|uniref:Uncharacterized protein n=1 Tax=Pseudolycoriella hygida TaxID=35572 RepID=A0A9Q0S9C5_9DIPT|nr:hypothetical protein Bhyg_03265 [Pseudolycoriella hygida]
MTDKLISRFNYKGIMGKLKLEGYEIIELIKDLYKPMDPKVFDKRMRTTIELAKNRYSNAQFRNRQKENISVEM